MARQVGKEPPIIEKIEETALKKGSKASEKDPTGQNVASRKLQSILRRGEVRKTRNSEARDQPEWEDPFRR